ncbi:MAG: hypothetical protein ACRDOE_00265 [Streptosporangiaceae bacterium]
MAVEVRVFHVVLAPGDSVGVPHVVALTFPPRLVSRIQVLVPPGPRGTVGFALGAAGVAVLPSEAGTFIVADGETIDWPLSRQIESGAWELFAYNAGVFAHTLEVRFLVELVQSMSVATRQPLLVTA